MKFKHKICPVCGKYFVRLKTYFTSADGIGTNKRLYYHTLGEKAQACLQKQENPK